MLCINNNPVEDYVFRLNLDSYLGIYMTTLKEDQLRIVDENRRKQDKVKENSKLSNSINMAYWIIKQGSSYDNILYTVVNLLSSRKTTEDSTESILKYILNLSSDTLKDDFILMGENISDLPNLKNKWPRWILKGDGVSISSKREKEKLPSSQVGQGWIKVGDILSDPDSSNVYPTIIFQPSQLYLCAEEIISPPTLHHEVAIII